MISRNMLSYNRFKSIGASTNYVDEDGWSQRIESVRLKPYSMKWKRPIQQILLNSPFQACLLEGIKALTK